MNFLSTMNATSFCGLSDYFFNTLTLKLIIFIIGASFDKKLTVLKDILHIYFVGNQLRLTSGLFDK